ncbi:hypothetical protein [Mycoplasma sp. ATU-Cv-703]|uniref:hypothetical protein n=2 Tax=unclassified Mycoplasma TaxID=2683645 RepID=UPI000FDDE105
MANINQSVVDNNTRIANVMSIEPYMLPVGFRQRSRFSQRLYVLLIVIIHAFVIGFVVYSAIGNDDAHYIANRFKFWEGERPMILINWLTLISLLFVCGVVQFWSRSRPHKISFWEMIGYLIAPVTLLTGISLIETMEGPDYRSLLWIIVILQIVMAASSSFYALVLNLARSRIYPNAKWRTLATLIGPVVVSLNAYLIWRLYDVSQIRQLDIMLGAFLPWVIGVTIMAIGIAATLKLNPSSKRSIWKVYRYLGALPTAVTFSAMLAISIKFAFGIKWQTLLWVVVGIDSAFLLAFMLYLFINARLRNIPRTNPIINELVLRSYVIAVALVGLTAVEFLPVIYPHAKEYATMSYAILFVTCLTVVSGMAWAHFSNLITFSKYFRILIGVSMAATAAIVGLVFTVVFVENTIAIMNIVADKLIVLFLLIALAPEMISITIDLIYLVGYGFVKHLTDRRQATLVSPTTTTTEVR